MIDDPTIFLSLLDPWYDAIMGDGSFKDAILEPYLTSPFVDEIILATMIWLTLGVGLYIYGEGLVLPITITIIYFGLITSTLFGPLVGIVLLVILIMGALLFGKIVWDANRG